jgi:hypothetical protein
LLIAHCKLTEREGLALMIPCSEKCVYEEDGLCALKSVTPPSNTPTKDCPYFTKKEKKDDS